MHFADPNALGNKHFDKCEHTAADPSYRHRDRYYN